MIAEQRQENEMRDQLEIYKKLRQSHQKEVLILESRLQAEMNEHRRTLDKEYDSQVHGQGSLKVPFGRFGQVDFTYGQIPSVDHWARLSIFCLTWPMGEIVSVKPILGDPCPKVLVFRALMTE